MADHSTTSQHHNRRPERRRAHAPYHRGVHFQRVVAHFNRTVDEHFPIEWHPDRRGRQRARGRGARARAFAVLLELSRRQRQVRSGVVYESYPTLGALIHRSRTTAYRAVRDLRRVQLLGCRPGGGKTFDERGDLVNAANGYCVPDELAGPQERQRRKPAPVRPQPVSRRGQDLVDEARERFRTYRGRAGP